MNWQKRVRERMEASNPAGEICDEVIVELAAHLEQVYEQACVAGLSNAAAIKIAEQEVDSWRRLARDIRRAKHEEAIMNHRTKSLWLPGMITLLGASVLLALLQILGVRPELVWVRGMGMVYYWPWLAGLPVFGALGAYLSQRAQGQIRARIMAALSPALVMLIVMSMILPFGLVLDGWDFLRLVAFGLALLNWVVLPGLALLLGAAPFLRGAKLQEA